MSWSASVMGQQLLLAGAVAHGQAALLVVVVAQKSRTTFPIAVEAVAAKRVEALSASQLSSSAGGV